MENKHSSRIEAEKNFKVTSAAVRNFSGSDLARWDKVNADFTAARDALVAAEMSHPTTKEVSRRAHKRELSNRGLDV